VSPAAITGTRGLVQGGWRKRNVTMASNTYLLLENGSLYEGEGFGAPAPLSSDLEPGKFTYRHTGEIVFNTAHSGYYEVLTDPSYTGQIIAMTYPHMGNYGTDPLWNESSIEQGRVSRPIKAAGFVVRSVYNGPVAYDRGDFGTWLANNDIPGITGVDTRRLTLELRNTGSKRAVIFRSLSGTVPIAQEQATVVAYLKAFPDMVGCNLIGDVGTTVYQKIKPEAASKSGLGPAPQKTFAGLHVALLDCGNKANILSELLARSCTVSLFPSTASSSDILAVKPDGVLISNGPGDPSVLKLQIDTVKGLFGKLPVCGICLGHQLIGLALGANTYKMKFGHHGINHPVRDELTKSVFVTSQNHGFAVDEKTLPEDVAVWFRNANDQSVEGLVSSTRKIRTAQFHPESNPGPYDSLWIFDAFLEDMQLTKQM